MLSLILVFVSLALPPKEQANAYLSGFNPENIISDMAMMDTSTMDVNSVQQFLNAAVPVCDTNGDKLYSANMTRRDYARLTWGVAPPFTCLKSYVPNGRSAAQIIVEAGRAYGINPQVLLVLLQKEQGLITDEWPTPIQYQKATGFGCPDTAACNPAYSGFASQVQNAAASFRSIMNGARSNYPAGQVNYVRYSPDVNCGGANIFIRNRATSALYHYTPYQPNAAALAAGRGSAPCGAYGNRNFYNYFTDWFGSTQKPLPGCDSRVPGVACVWELRAPTGEMFYTASIAERNNIAYNAGFTFVRIAYYARTDAGAGMIPVFRLNNVGRAGYHLLTASPYERDALVAGGALYEGVAFYAQDTANGNVNYTVYRLSGPGGHVLTASTATVASLRAAGYTLESNAFYSASGMGATPTPPTGKSNIYRMALPGDHFYTTNVAERDTLIATSRGSYEGVGFYASLTDTSTPVYRFNLGRDHFYTTSAYERDVVGRSGGAYEGVAWYLDASTPLYRLGGPEHFYTASLAELNNTMRAGYSLEFIYAPYPRENTPVYRAALPGDHFYTTNLAEAYNACRATGSRLEGIGWFTDNSTDGTPVYRFNLGGDHFYTANTSERDNVIRSGGAYEGVAFFTKNDNTRPPVYSLRVGSEHFYTTSAAERDNVTRAAGVYEGVRFYSK